jgi:spore germination protein KA
MSDSNSNTPIQPTVSANLEQLAAILNHSADLNTEIHGIGDCAGIAYLRSLVDLNDLKSHLLEPLLPLLAEANRSPRQITVTLPAITPHDCPDLETAASDLLEGRTVLFLAGATTAVSFATQGWVKREPKEPLSERVLRGPREGFTETLDDNIGMVRRWVKDPQLHVDTETIGRRSKTKVAVMYLGDVAQSRLVKENAGFGCFFHLNLF